MRRQNTFLRSSAPRKRRLWAVLFPIIALASGLTQAETLKIGALLSLNGNWSNLGQASAVIMRMAENDINAYLQSHRTGYRIKVQTVNTALEPNRAVAGYNWLVQHNAVAVVGPQSSSEVAALIDIVSNKRVSIISQGSTASSITKPGDHVYRFVPTDVHEAQATNSVLKQKGVEYLIPLWRDDVGNNGLHQSVTTQFAKAGGTVYQGVQYSSTQQDFSAVASEANRQVTQALAAAGNAAGKIAIYTASFDEIASLMDAAVQYPNLRNVHWTGGDGVVQSVALQNDPIASAFAISVGYLSPNFGLSAYSAPKSQEISNRFKAITGQTPDAFTLAAYDATWVAALTAYGKKSVMKSSRPDTLAATADLYFGATGWTQLDPNGDRASGDYDFWGLVRAPNGTVNWAVLCHFSSMQNITTGSSCAP